MARRRDGEALFWTILLWLDIAWLILNAVFGIVTGIILVVDPDSEYATKVAEEVARQSSLTLYLEVLLTFALFGLIPLLWIWRTRLGGWPAAREYLRLHTPARSLGIGVGAGLGLVVAMLIFLVAADKISCTLTGRSFGQTDGPNPVTDAISLHLSIPLILAISLAAGIGEEIFFRGLVQRQLGFWLQAILFSVAHATNASIVQLLVTLPIGLLFGWWIRRGGSMYATIAAHFTYDFVLLSLAYYATQDPDLMGAATEGCA